jgi:addiction module HigA family antidote
MGNRKPTHPGTVVKLDILEPLELSVTAAAEILKYSRKHFSAFLNGRARCTTELAVKLAAATGTTAQSWLAMQSNYDLWEAEHAHLAKGVVPFSEFVNA